ncbi:hypothetical protein JIQ42_00972 [Leishmania sp. Namibia]|uniref:hypothetical protein n=1 Tax=Leishmania sp. Namibia TaxID=2802991 RepID=UPI001B3DCC48|nr:hypothetical protein JIQ42_00972 [Leishmania sp. Namibia]
MPPKRVKDFSDAPVFSMTHEEQVQLLSDALLREYMHRRGFLATLKAFDDERPRDANTISSRALMSDLMALNPDEQQRMKGEGIETIMEMLCNLRVERRLEMKKLTSEAHMPLPKVPANYEVLKKKQAEREARRAERLQQKEFSSRKPSKATAGEPQRNKRNHSKHHQRRSIISRSRALRGNEAVGITMDDLLGSSRSSSDKVNEHSGLDKGEEEGGSSCTSDTAERTGARSAAQSPASHGGLSSSKNASTPSAQPAWMEVAAKQKSKLTKETDSGGGVQRGASDDDGDKYDGVSGEEGEENDDDLDNLGGAAMTAEQRDQLSAAFQLLCGFDGCLHKAFLEQGFTFDDCTDCALIQWQPGGCDGVIAPIQAFVAAFYYEREMYVGKEQRQRECLVKALGTSLEQAQPNASKIVLIDSVWRAERGSSRYTRSHALHQAATPRTRCWSKMASMQEVTQVLRDTLLTEERWMKPRDGGLASFLFSLLLSHGVDVIQQELTAASTADSGRPSLLLHTSGQATLGLANLVLTGRAIFFRHNGVRNGHQVGYTSRLRCGLLCGDSAADSDGCGRAAAVGVTSASPISYTNATEPQLPSWVLWHRGHFSNLYMPKDTRQLFQQKLSLGGSASIDLVYWDAATEDDEFTLTVTAHSIALGVGSGSDGGARNAKSFVNTAITSVPAWSSAAIDWNGKVPLRD